MIYHSVTFECDHVTKHGNQCGEGIMYTDVPELDAAKKAQRARWSFPSDGSIYCPKHAHMHRNKPAPRGKETR